MAQTPDTIDVIEQVLDTPAALAAIAFGIFVGCVGLYVWQNYQKGLIESVRRNTINSLNMIAAENNVPESDEVQDYGAQQDSRINEYYAQQQ